MSDIWNEEDDDDAVLETSTLSFESMDDRESLRVPYRLLKFLIVFR